MGTLVLIPWPETVWSAAGRIAGRTPLPLTETGQALVHSWTNALPGKQLRTVFSSDEQASTETARVVAQRCSAKHKILPDLVEVDAGLWDGLTTDELKRRYPKVFKRWLEDPSTVCPPEGEAVAAARERLAASLEQMTRKLGHHEAAAVLGPVAFGIMRCVIESAELVALRSLMHVEPLRYHLTETGASMEPQPLSSAPSTSDVSTSVSRLSAREPT